MRKGLFEKMDCLKFEKRGYLFGNFVDKVNGRAGNLHTFFQGGLMHPQAIEAVAAETGDEARMHIEDAVVIGTDHILRQDGQEARQHHQM